MLVLPYQWLEIYGKPRIMKIPSGNGTSEQTSLRRRPRD